MLDGTSLTLLALECLFGLLACQTLLVLADDWLVDDRLLVERMVQLFFDLVCQFFIVTFITVTIVCLENIR
jgi:hypothetical protein